MMISPLFCAKRGINFFTLFNCLAPGALHFFINLSFLKFNYKPFIDCPHHLTALLIVSNAIWT